VDETLMQTRREFDASIRVLSALKTPQSATIILTWDDDMQRAYVGLGRMGYVQSRTQGSGRGAFRWDLIEATPLGLTYLAQIRSAQKKVG
jgi:hypothetical protein